MCGRVKQHILRRRCFSLVSRALRGLRDKLLTSWIQWLVLVEHDRCEVDIDRPIIPRVHKAIRPTETLGI